MTRNCRQEKWQKVFDFDFSTAFEGFGLRRGLVKTLVKTAVTWTVTKWWVSEWKDPNQAKNDADLPPWALAKPVKESGNRSRDLWPAHFGASWGLGKSDTFCPFQPVMKGKKNWTWIFVFQDFFWIFWFKFSLSPPACLSSFVELWVLLDFLNAVALVYVALYRSYSSFIAFGSLRLCILGLRVFYSWSFLKHQHNGSAFSAGFFVHFWKNLRPK